MGKWTKIELRKIFGGKRRNFNNKKNAQKNWKFEYDEKFYSKIEAEQLEPHEWHSETRKMKREIIFHMGPTNSGKTFEAIKALK